MPRACPVPSHRRSHLRRIWHAAGPQRWLRNTPRMRWNLCPRSSSLTESKLRHLRLAQPRRGSCQKKISTSRYDSTLHFSTSQNLIERFWVGAMPFSGCNVATNVLDGFIAKLRFSIHSSFARHKSKARRAFVCFGALEIRALVGTNENDGHR
ncbi:hypothetical protein BC826DRAFT_440838 [Russula brevipes]|nr:hypothetical protein BC826DRAFT_440838 [Russula brevipes]